ncbi:hypothetical protein ACTXT7_011026 [Hymenolepis weldensis]
MINVKRSVCQDHIDRIERISQVTRRQTSSEVAGKPPQFINKHQLCPVAGGLGVMLDTCLGIHTKTSKHTTGPPVDTVVEILSLGVDRHLLTLAEFYCDTKRFKKIKC